MSATVTRAGAAPRGRRWLSRPAVRLHLPLALGVPGCLAAGWFELTRAMAGREVAWVYAVEWPMYAVAGTYVWWRLRRAEAAEKSARPDARSGPRRAGHPDLGPAGSARPALAGAVADPPGGTGDPELAAWQRYLRDLHEADPPGGPPARG